MLTVDDNVAITKSILTIVLHYGDPTTTGRCCRSLEKMHELDVVVIDNDPLQNLTGIQMQINEPITILKSGGEMGFSQANNFGVKKRLNKNHRAILLLNNDILLIDKSIRFLYGVIEDEFIGAVAPCIYYSDRRDKIWAAGGSINRLRLLIYGVQSIKKNEEIYEVNYLPGAVMLCRTDVWKKFNGLPEKYFLAYEEAEFALQLKSSGLKSMVNTKAKAFHDVGMSSEATPMYLYNAMRNRIKLGSFLYGRPLGIILGAINNLDIFFRNDVNATILTHLLYLKLWAYSFYHEISGLPLNRQIVYKFKSMGDRVL